MSLKQVFCTGQASSDEEDEVPTRLEGSSETQSDRSVASLAVRLLLTEILASAGPFMAPQPVHVQVGCQLTL